jgi:hypothetical protein
VGPDPIDRHREHTHAPQHPLRAHQPQPGQQLHAAAAVEPLRGTVAREWADNPRFRLCDVATMMDAIVAIRAHSSQV